MTNAIIVINSGSTSLKFGAYAVSGADTPPLLCQGEIEGMEDDPRFAVSNASGKQWDTHAWGKDRPIDHKTALQFVITWLEANIAGLKVAAAGHRIVLGGSRYAAPVQIDDDVLTYLDSLVVMEPSHQPYNVRGARALKEAFPGLPQVACFDTSFHRTMPEVAQTYALPKDVRDAGVRHWGYHGISYDYISRQVPKVRAQSTARDCCTSRGRRQHVRDAGWKERGDEHGLRRHVGPADGDALRRPASRRLVLPVAQQIV